MLNLKVMLLCLSATVVFCAIEPGESDISILEDCMSKTNKTEENNQPHHHQIEPLKIQAPKCFIGCVMRERGLIKNGNTSAEALKTYLMNLIGKTEHIRRLIFKKVEHVVDVCTHKDDLPNEECALAKTLNDCITEESQKAEITDEHGILKPELNTLT